jgi:hypothetical protein
MPLQSTIWAQKAPFTLYCVWKPLTALEVNTAPRCSPCLSWWKGYKLVLMQCMPCHIKTGLFHMQSNKCQLMEQQRQHLILPIHSAHCVCCSHMLVTWMHLFPPDCDVLFQPHPLDCLFWIVTLVFLRWSFSILITKATYTKCILAHFALVNHGTLICSYSYFATGSNASHAKPALVSSCDMRAPPHECIKNLRQFEMS